MENLDEVDPLAISRFHELVDNAKDGARDKPTAAMVEDSSMSQ